MNYAMAEYLEGDDGNVCLAVPDLDIDMGHINRFEARKGQNDLIVMHLQEGAERGQLPPRPRDIPELRELYPSYSDWDWSWTSIAITEYLEPMAIKT
jgi:hypothetical protein